VVLLVVAVAAGLVAGQLRRPLGVHAVRLRLRRLGLLALGAAGNVASLLVDSDLAAVALGASLVALLTFAAANAHLTGVLVVGVGLLSNLAALVVNNGMPVRPDALVAADVVERDELADLELDEPRHLETGADRAPWLGDIVPVPITREVLSFGDLIVVAGAADAMRDLVRRRRGGDRDAQGDATTQASAVHD
jgi:hypothetical protein